MMLPLGLYVHIPFCRSRCSYCDFNTYAGLEALYAPYVRALEREIQAVAAALPGGRRPADTLFVGGGTPSVLPADAIGGVIAACRQAFDLPPAAEVTVECNPGTVDAAYLGRLRAAGVNRLSFGAQSADAGELQLLGRRHTFAGVVAAVDVARQAGFDNLSFDLIFGLPCQALETWQRTLDAALPLAPDHISLYALTVEPGTPLHDRVRRGELPDPDPDVAAAMYECAEERLDRAGYVHYEISNWRRPGRECRHNLIYWRNEPYFGFGPGAHSSSIRRRWWNVLQPADYIARIQGGQPVEAGHEDIDEQVSQAETLIMGLRLLQEGVSFARFAGRHGQPMQQAFADALRRSQANGLLELTADRARLTQRGRFLSNQVFSLLV